MKREVRSNITISDVFQAQADIKLNELAKSKTKLRAAARGLSSEQLRKLIGNLQEILRSVEEKEAAKLKAAKRAKIGKIRALMAESGISAEDLASFGKRGRPSNKPRRKTKSKVAPKYRLVVDGAEYLWTGRGRPPKVFKEYLDAGNSKDSCAI